DISSDIALLEIENYKGPVLQLEDVKDEDENYYLATYQGLSFHITDMSFIHSDTMLDDIPFHQFSYDARDIHMNGSSGSPVLNNEGKVVGMISWGSERIVYVVKSEKIRELLDSTREEGFKLWQANKSIKRKMDELIISANTQNDFNAQFFLGQKFFEGERYAGVAMDKNHEAALSWFGKAAEQGHCIALYMLGHLHFNGRPPDSIIVGDWGETPFFNYTDIEQNLEKAFNNFKEAANQGCIDGQNKLDMHQEYW
ncbi:MAG: bifunctional trypsin-like peptidase domain-containing/SEL1-like repeat protein, partial [Halobacteriovoraceae bacterium]|nr:bifunctional trypsin-like peptidase domain-containing/SEL1-like repeat protein [Halobacteriovoraceae bacterium]